MLTLQTGATHTDIANAINADGTFAASAATAGSSTFNAGDVGVFTGEFSGGSNTVAPGTFDLTAVNGGQADGLKGNSTTVEFTSGASNGAVYDPDANKITVTVEANATIADIANTINSDLAGDFVAANVTNGNYFYSTTANGVNAGAFSGGGNTVNCFFVPIASDDRRACWRYRWKSNHDQLHLRCIELGSVR